MEVVMRSFFFALCTAFSVAAFSARAEDAAPPVPLQPPVATAPTAGGLMMGKDCPGMDGAASAHCAGMGNGVHKFSESDTDGDGKLTKEEFLANAEKRFKEMDTDGNASISPDELSAYRQKSRMMWKQRMMERRGGGMMMQPQPAPAPAGTAP
jgi:hypothetical protein